MTSGSDKVLIAAAEAADRIEVERVRGEADLRGRHVKTGRVQAAARSRQVFASPAGPCRVPQDRGARPARHRARIAPAGGTCRYFTLRRAIEAVADDGQQEVQP